MNQHINPLFQSILSSFLSTPSIAKPESNRPACVDRCGRKAVENSRRCRLCAIQFAEDMRDKQTGA